MFLFFHTANNQASDQNLILILYYSHLKDCCPTRSQTYSWSLIAIKSILYQDIIRTKMTTHKQMIAPTSQRIYNEF